MRNWTVMFDWLDEICDEVNLALPLAHRGNEPKEICAKPRCKIHLRSFIGDLIATETKPLTDLNWPAGLRLPVVLTFEHQSGEGAPLLPGERFNAMIGGAMQYGARTGIWNILELLDKLGVKATFLVCGMTAEKYPDAICATRKAGHEIAGMSYAFNRVRTMSAERERGVVRRTAKALKEARFAATRLFAEDRRPAPTKERRTLTRRLAPGTSGWSSYRG